MSDGNDKNEFPPGEGGAAPDENGGGLPLGAGRPAVAAAPGKTIFVMIGVAIFVLIVVKELFYTSSTAPPPEKKVKEHVVASAQNQNMSPINGLPTPPAEIPPPPPPPPPAQPPVLPTPPVPEVKTNGPSDEELMARLRANSLIKNSAPSLFGTPRESARDNAMAGNDPNLAFAQSAFSSKAGFAEATKVGNLNIMIVQGKIIHAVLESAINSDLPGLIRAIVSHDIYAEAGRSILIPKGSRLVGAYNAQIKHGQERVYIIWTRVIRPDGIDIAINSPGVDALGRAGMGGAVDGTYVDNKYFEAYESAILTSLLDLGVAGVGQGLFGSQQSTTTAGSSGTTTATSGSAGAAAVTQAVQSVGTVSQSIVANTLNLSPTITVDQGTQINIFVNKDLVFSPNVTGHSAFIE